MAEFTLNPNLAAMLQIADAGAEITKTEVSLPMSAVCRMGVVLEKFRQFQLSYEVEAKNWAKLKQEKELWEARCQGLGEEVEDLNAQLTRCANDLESWARRAEEREEQVTALSLRLENLRLAGAVDVSSLKTDLALAQEQIRIYEEKGSLETARELRIAVCWLLEMIEKPVKGTRIAKTLKLGAKDVRQRLEEKGVDYESK